MLERGWNSLFKTNARAAVNREAIPEGMGRAHDKIIRARRQSSIVAAEDYAGCFRCREFQRVMKADGLKDSINFMIPIAALSQDAQIQIDFGKSRKS